MKLTLLFCSIFFLVAPSVFTFTGPPVLFSQGQTFPPFAGLPPFAQEEARVLKENTQIFQSTSLWFNTYRNDMGRIFPGTMVIMDTEGLNSTLEWKYGLSHKMEMSLQLQGLVLFPGVLDTTLSGFHQLFGFPNQSRETARSNALNLSIYKNNQEILWKDTSVGSLTQWSAGLKYEFPQLFPGEGVFSTKLVYKGPLPSNSSLYLLQNWSLGFLGLYSDELPLDLFGNPACFRWGLTIGMNYLSTNNDPLPVLSWLYTGGFHGGVVINNWFAGVQGSVIQAPYDMVSNYLGVRSGEIHIGTKGPIGDSVYVEVALVEEFLTYGTLEVGFYTGIMWLW